MIEIHSVEVLQLMPKEAMQKFRYARSAACDKPQTSNKLCLFVGGDIRSPAPSAVLASHRPRIIGVKDLVTL
jgi:hypothetical protein